ncbi:MAG: hypothetical protein JXR03_21025 [Cyclobacteriaceae bacterium]
MKEIRVNSSNWSGLTPDFAKVSSLKIQNDPFSSGGFGEIYHCQNVNGKTPGADLVVKLFFGSSNIISKGYETINNLQQKIKKRSDALKSKGADFITEYPALVASPQFSFKGKLNGKEVVGYAANNLKSLGFEEFTDILSDETLLKTYRNGLSLNDKLLIAHQLVATFDLFREFLYIHADFKADALFVNLKNKKCAIIDFDSGAIVQSENDKPTTWGTPQDWLAPEIFDQLGEGLSKRTKANAPIDVKVDLQSDRWSVAVCVHFLIFTWHPFFFFSEISKRTLKDYALSSSSLPDVSSSFRYLKKDVDTQKLRIFYKKKFDSLPTSLKDKFRRTFDVGSLKPEQRTTYSQWKLVLGSTQKPPVIKAFLSDRKVIKDGNGALLSWKVENASQVFLNGIEVTGLNSYRLSLKQDTKVKLEVKNSFASKTKELSIQVSKDPSEIVFFETTLPNNYLSRKEGVKLKWMVKGYESLKIVPNNIDVSGKTELVISPPKRDTTYELIAVTFFGVVTKKRLTISVNKQAPDILEFSCDKKIVSNKTDPALLSWNVSRAEIVEIDTGIGSVNLRASQLVCPKADTLYTLKATSYFGIESKRSIKLAVSKKPPKINFFKSNKYFLWKKGTIDISWKVENSEKVYLKPIGDVSGVSKKAIQIEKDMTLSLVATTYFGVSSIETIKIETSKEPPVVDFFNISKDFVENGESVKVSWSSPTAEKVEISHLGTLPPTGNRMVTPKKEMVFSLNAYSDFGAVNQSNPLRLSVSRKPPSIKLKSNPLLKDKTKAVLTWTVDGAEKVYLQPEPGVVNNRGELDVEVTLGTTYTIKAISIYGYESQKSVKPESFFKEFKREKLIAKPKILSSSKINFRSKPDLNL